MRRTQKQEAGPDYDKGVKYWEGVESSMDGVLGGFGEGVSSFGLLRGLESGSGVRFALGVYPDSVNG